MILQETSGKYVSANADYYGFGSAPLWSYTSLEAAAIVPQLVLPPVYDFPVPRMPDIPVSIEALLKRIFDAITDRIDALAMFTRDSTGGIVMQISAVGSKATDLFSIDRWRARVDGSTVLYGSIELPARAVTATTVVLATDFLLKCDATSAAISVYLPAANLSAGRVYAVKKVDASANAVTIRASGSDLIDGSATNAIAAQWNGRILQSDGLAWYIVATI